MALYQSATAQFVDSTDVMDLKNAPDGSFIIKSRDEDGECRHVMWIKLPFKDPKGECWEVRPLDLYCEGQRANRDPSWLWDGDEERPTLLPSIVVRPPGDPELWHGWLRNGQLLSV